MSILVLGCVGQKTSLLCGALWVKRVDKAPIALPGSTRKKQVPGGHVKGKFKYRKMKYMRPSAKPQQETLLSQCHTSPFLVHVFCRILFDFCYQMYQIWSRAAFPSKRVLLLLITWRSSSRVFKVSSCPKQLPKGRIMTCIGCLVFHRGILPWIRRVPMRYQSKASMTKPVTESQCKNN